MGELKFCKAQKQDWPYIQEKIKKYMLDGTDASYDQFYIAKLGDKTVAFGKIFDRGDFFEIGTLGVDYYHRGKNIGVKLLDFIISEVRKIDASKDIYGVTHVPWFPAKSGFKEVSQWPDFIEEKIEKVFSIDRSKITVMKYMPE